MSTPWLSSSDHTFPAIDTAQSNGLLAAGGDLSSERLLAAYRQGIFPWYDESQPILWWSPAPRTVLFPEHIHISASLRKCLKKQPFTVRCDSAFKQVITHCANVPRAGQEGTWINAAMIDAYQRLHEQGYAHSIETWQQGQLVGGVYGIAIGRVFFGESMFSLTSNASKVALVYLARQLQAWDFPVIDCQVSNPHLSSMGAQSITRDHFLQLLAANVDRAPIEQWTERFASEMSTNLTNPSNVTTLLE